MTRQVVRFVLLAVILGIAWLVGPARQTPQNPAPKSIPGAVESSRSASAPVSAGRETRQTWGRMDTLADHFARHGRDFGAHDPDDYAAQAAALLQKAHAAGLPAKRDADGSLRVFDPSTGAFGAYNRNGTTKTFFKPRDDRYFDRQPGTPVDLRAAR